MSARNCAWGLCSAALHTVHIGVEHIWSCGSATFPISFCLVTDSLLIEIIMRPTVSRPVVLRPETKCAFTSLEIIFRQLPFLLRGSLSDERTGLWFTDATAGPRQRSLSRVWFPQDWWTYFETHPKLKTQVPISPHARNRVAQSYSRALNCHTTRNSSCSTL
jgi:hypothetical protein